MQEHSKLSVLMDLSLVGWVENLKGILRTAEPNPPKSEFLNQLKHVFFQAKFC